MTETTTLLQRLGNLDTNTISDALDFLGLAGATTGLHRLWNCASIVGRASTVQLGPRQNHKPTLHLISPVIDAVTSDDRILVIAGGREGVSCWGDILANAAKQKNVRGTIIDGFSRDITGSESINYPVYGRGITMISARNRVVQIDSGCAIQVAGTTVQENDFVIADRCGSVFISAGKIIQVVDLAEKIDARQTNMVNAVWSGRSVAEVMHDKEFEAIRHSQEVQS
jgi:regulator of RNase E activity RraA